MKRLATTLMVVLALMLPPIVPVAHAQACVGLSTQLTPMDFETITVSTVAIGFTASKISTATAKASYAFFTLETADIRYRVDGVDPTAAVGHAATSTVPGYFVCGITAVSQFRAIRSGGSDSTMRVTYFKGA